MSWLYLSYDRVASCIPVALLLPVLLAGCSTTLQPEWSLVPPPGVADQLEKKLPSVAFADTALPEAVADIARSVDALSSHEITLRLSSSESAMPDPPSITFTGLSIPLREALRNIALLSHHRLVYGERLIVLAPWSSGEGTTTVVFEGQCRDAATQEAIPSATVHVDVQGEDDHKADGKCDAEGLYSISMQLKASFDILQVDGREMVLPRLHPQRALLKVDAPLFQSETHVVDLDKCRAAYEVDVDLQPE